MSEERLKKLGLAQELETELRRERNRAKGIIGSLSDATFLRDPENPWVIDGQKVLDFAGELFTTIAQGNRLRQRIEHLKDELGI